MHKNIIITASLLGAVTVALGAFAAHGLKQILDEKMLQTFETGVRYQFYHVFALLITGILYQTYPHHYLVWATRLFIAGMIMFCGSLYLLALFSPQYRFLGAITPFGGSAFIAGWIFLGLGVGKHNKSASNL
jgi:uncharacterized membrane protein YgdD (TMEM256/DUF423 family)